MGGSAGPVREYDTVSFLSDYGLVDEFVGVVKGVLRDLAPHATVIDITHNVPPHDIRSGSLTLARSVQYLPEGIVLAVVDPGVGTDRRAIAVEVAEGRGVLIGPDNGLLAPAVAMAGGATRVVEITNPDHRLGAPGPTFDGRDVFAPAAAALCNGVALTDLGPQTDPSSLTPGMMPVSQFEDGTFTAEVLWVDHFGNAQLNLDPDELAPHGSRFTLETEDATRTVRQVRAFAELGTGEIGLVVDSYGLVAVVMDRMPAARELGLDEGSGVSLTPLGDDASRHPTRDAAPDADPESRGRSVTVGNLTIRRGG